MLPCRKQQKYRNRSVLIVKNNCDDRHHQLMIYIKLYLMHIICTQQLLNEETPDCATKAKSQAYALIKNFLNIKNRCWVLCLLGYCIKLLKLKFRIMRAEGSEKAGFFSACCSTSSFCLCWCYLLTRGVCVCGYETRAVDNTGYVHCNTSSNTSYSLSIHWQY